MILVGLIVKIKNIKYILNNFNANVLIFDKVHKADKNHPGNFNYVHYEPPYYQEFNKKLNLIIERDTFLNYKFSYLEVLEKLIRNYF